MSELWNDGKAPQILDAEKKLQIATPLLMEVGEDGLPDYGAYVTFQNGNPIIHHSPSWRPKE